jgi:hypothetical protein
MAKKIATFTPAEKALIQSAARQVWEEVAYDLLQAVAEEGRSSVSRAEAIEVALDAGRAEDILRRLPGVTKEFLKRYDEADYKTLIAAVRPAFPFASYGL